MRHENVAITSRNGGVGCAASPDGCSEEERIDEFRFGPAIEERDGLDHVRKGEPPADRDVHAVLCTNFCDFADNVKRVWGERHFADVFKPFSLFFHADGYFRGDGHTAIAAVSLEELAEGVRRDVFGQHDGKRHLVAHFRTAQYGFRLLVARDDDGRARLVVDGDLKTVLALFVTRSKVVENNQVEIVDIFRELFFLLVDS